MPKYTEDTAMLSFRMRHSDIPLGSNSSGIRHEYFLSSGTCKHHSQERILVASRYRQTEMLELEVSPVRMGLSRTPSAPPKMQHEGLEGNKEAKRECQNQNGIRDIGSTKNN